MPTQTNLRRTLVAATVLALLAGACATDDAIESASADDATTTESATDVPAAIATEVTTAGGVDTTAGVQAALWTSNVEITLNADTFTFTSDSIPSHELPDQILIPSAPPGSDDPMYVATDYDTLLTPKELVVEIPLNPVYSEEVTDNPLGQIGVVISGAQLFNDFEDMERSVVAIDDQTTIDGVSFLDPCNGHPLASGDDYHYHGVPYCITDTIDVDGQHSTVVGFMLDGFPVYGNKDADGETITNDDLDECSGHFGSTPEFPDGIYHYHLTDDAAPYSINCYHGVVDDTVTQGGNGAPGGGGQPGGEGPPDGQGPPEGQGPPDGQAPPEPTED